MLHLNVKPGDRVEIEDGRIVVHVESKSGQVSRLAFDVPQAVKVRMIEKDEASGVRRLAPVVG
jgi:formylmethanofuran dehydrogenase subunit D